MTREAWLDAGTAIAADQIKAGPPLAVSGPGRCWLSGGQGLSPRPWPPASRSYRVRDASAISPWS